MPTTTLNEKINDVFIISAGGLPYYSICLGKNYCMHHPDHVLQSGFIAALFQFASEFGQKSIKEVRFDELYMFLSHKELEEKGLIAVIVAESNVNSDDYQQLTEKLLEEFVSKYKADIQNDNLIDLNKYSDFSTFLVNAEIIDHSPQVLGLLLRKKPSFLKRIIGK